jgi:hypothetical protein
VCMVRIGDLFAVIYCSSAFNLSIFYGAEDTNQTVSINSGHSVLGAEEQNVSNFFFVKYKKS